jgi:hypothetical protein
MIIQEVRIFLEIKTWLQQILSVVFCETGSKFTGINQHLAKSLADLQVTHHQMTST